MGQLLSFLYRFRAFFTFLLLELICIWLIVRHNDYQRSSFNSLMSATVGTINESTGNISEYFSLKKTNQQLAEENARLRSLLLSLEPLPTDSLAGNLIPVDSADTTALSFELITAEIIRNDIRSTKNFFMINKFLFKLL